METQLIIQIVTACGSGLGVIIAFIVSFLKIFGAGKKIKLLSQDFEKARLDWLEKEKDYKSRIVELDTTIKKQEIELFRATTIISRYEERIKAYDNRDEAKLIKEYETKLSHYENTKDSLDYRILEAQKLLEIEKNKTSALLDQLNLKDNVIKKQKQELNELEDLKKSTEALSTFINNKFIPIISNNNSETTSSDKLLNKEEASAAIIS
ncbi:Uncharacterised protein [Mycoplasmopsis maculosa]|uniref:Uncharacterized protein n=1 Tax=Mycoplasmopsis maculosa TaxID=114885 RepID=A0A449B4V0_9BACT|nr:hypothetical protein [Mycoplasmopsis maculosa]VEU75595.1 Uncharacterised protein [Mycoplasmopsis maculosa]